MLRRILAVPLTVGLLLSGAGSVRAAGPTFDEIFSATPAWGSQPSRFVWAPDGRSFLYVLSTQDPSAAPPVRQYDVQSANSRVLIEPAHYGDRPAPAHNIAWSPDGSRLAFTEHGTLYVRDTATNLERALAQKVSDALWSPRGDAIAFTSGANLFVAYLTPKLRTVRLTSDGVPDTILNGDLDWVYPEELGTEHGFAWSSDGRAIAYMRMDERSVTNFPIVDFLPADNAVSYQRYPLAGERNPRVTLHEIDLTTLAEKPVYDAGAHDEYLPFFAYKPGTRALVAELLDRSQKRLRVLAWNGGAPAQLYSQTAAQWVDDIPLPVWLGDGSSLWLLARENSHGLYLRSRAGALKRLTGSYATLELLSVDEKNGIAYVSAAYPTRRDTALLAVPLRGGAPRDLTPAAGANSISLAPGFGHFIDTHSTLSDPPQVDLFDVAGPKLRATLAPRSESLAAQLLPVRMLEVPSQYGDLDAYMLEPPGFDPHKKYPVIIYVYGGPQAPTTANAFNNTRGLYHQMLARSGFIVFSVDGPASRLDDDARVRLLYHNFGPGSLLGQEIGVRYLQSLPYIDASRIGIWGWSFGGYETVYALTHSTLFKAGAAGAPVTDWHLYDTIYTERYMGLPKDDPKAYDESSNLNAMTNLHGDLLVSQGTSDDNVHVANSISLMQSAIAADQTHVDYMVYPRQRHGFTALADLRQLYEHMLQWWSAHL